MARLDSASGASYQCDALASFALPSAICGGAAARAVARLKTQLARSSRLPQTVDTRLRAEMRPRRCGGEISSAMNPSVFREYDIRGIVERDFDDDFVVSLGRAYATMLKRAGKATITLGRDCRLSSDRLFELLSAGLLQKVCINVVDIGGGADTAAVFFSDSLGHGWRRDDHR